MTESRIEASRRQRGFGPKNSNQENFSDASESTTTISLIERSRQQRGFASSQPQGLDSGPSFNPTPGSSRLDSSRQSRGFGTGRRPDSSQSQPSITNNQPGLLKSLLIAGSVATLDNTAQAVTGSTWLEKHAPWLQKGFNSILNSGKAEGVEETGEKLAKKTKTAQQIYREEVAKLAATDPDQSLRPSVRQQVLALPPSPEEENLARQIAGLPRPSQLMRAHDAQRERREEIIEQQASMSAAKLSRAYANALEQYDIQLEGRTGFIPSLLTGESWRQISWVLDIGQGVLTINNPQPGVVNQLDIPLSALAGDDPRILMIADNARYEDSVNNSLLFRLLKKSVTNRAGKVLFVSAGQVGDIQTSSISGQIEAQSYIPIRNPQQFADGIKRIADLRATGTQVWEHVGDQTIQPPLRAEKVLQLANSSYNERQIETKRARIKELVQDFNEIKAQAVSEGRECTSEEHQRLIKIAELVKSATNDLQAWKDKTKRA